MRFVASVFGFLLQIIGLLRPFFGARLAMVGFEDTGEVYIQSVPLIVREESQRT